MKHMNNTIVKSLLLVAFSAITLTLSAQTDEQKARVADVRRIYQEAGRLSEENRMAPETNNSMTVELQRMFGGSGMQTKKMEFYYNVDDESEDGTGWTLYMVRVSYNLSAQKFYEEYLFDERTGNLIFAFQQADDYDLPDGAKREYRSYFYADGKHCQTIGQVKASNGKTSVPKDMKDLTADCPKVKEAIATAHDLRTIFETAVNK